MIGWWYSTDLDVKEENCFRWYYKIRVSKSYTITPSQLQINRRRDKKWKRWHTRWRILGQLSWTPLARGHLLAVAGGMWQGEGWALRAVALLQLVLSCLFVSVGLGSESPDRECCDPLYPFIPIPELTTRDYNYPYVSQTPNWNHVTQEQQAISTKRWWPPEEPDWPYTTPRTTTKKKKTTKAKTFWPGMKYIKLIEEVLWRNCFRVVV